MRKVAKYLAGGAVAAVTALAALQPASAALVRGGVSVKAVCGSFPANPAGDIAGTPSSITQASLAVLAVGGAFVGEIQPDASIGLSTLALPFPLGPGPFPILAFTLTVDG